MADAKTEQTEISPATFIAAVEPAAKSAPRRALAVALITNLS